VCHGFGSYNTKQNNRLQSFNVRDWPTEEVFVILFINITARNSFFMIDMTRGLFLYFHVKSKFQLLKLLNYLSLFDFWAKFYCPTKIILSGLTMYSITKRGRENNRVKINFLYEQLFVILLSKHLFLPIIQLCVYNNKPTLKQFVCLFVAKFSTSVVLTLRRLMSYTYGAPILDVSRSHTTTQHSR